MSNMVVARGLFNYNVASNTNGEVHYYIKEFPGCCGICVVHDVVFKPKPRKKQKLYEDFLDFLKNSKELDTDGELKIVMSDRVRPRRAASLYDFCMTFPEISHGTAMHNPNSDNKVVCFELDRTINPRFKGTYL